MMRYRAKVDDNQATITAAFRALGCTVQPIHTVGRGVPDLLVATPDGRNCLVEVKDGSKPPSKRRLTPDEERWIAGWNGPVWIVNDADDAARLVGGDLPPFRS